MTGSHALSAEYSVVARRDASQSGPRSAEPIDPPVRSPVHELQDQLIMRQAAGFGDATGEELRRADAAPGWVRLSLPFSLSLGLWALIFWIVSLVR
ncbi:hypothetical protein [Novosphingobium sp. MMS21-SN21R]|uniref:hypothetical protein n=1 Tax=Novosphingobium sp. MMS21-SN21R TaxID=2969298 RepID=UPI002888C33B|nr:hypothetical protein [Novosphingobium sp. MMS21-SN21R]MDT0508612.1 hypothetical protein [Novosphingobium sp. MMS21-SN21R]